jgi:hypothetical protein
MCQGKFIRESSHEGNDKIARQMESAHRTSLAKGEVSICEKKTTDPHGVYQRSFRAVGRVRLRFKA